MNRKMADTGRPSFCQSANLPEGDRSARKSFVSRMSVRVHFDAPIHPFHGDQLMAQTAPGASDSGPHPLRHQLPDQWSENLQAHRSSALSRFPNHQRREVACLLRAEYDVTTTAARIGVHLGMVDDHISTVRCDSNFELVFVEVSRLLRR